MIVALRAADGQSHEHRADRSGHFAQHQIAGLVAARFGEGRESQEGQRHNLLRFRLRQFAGAGDLRQFVAGQLLFNELVIGLVVVESVDDVVAIAPGVRVLRVPSYPAVSA